MSPVLDTAFVPPGEREETIRHAVWESVVPVDIDHHLPADDLSVRIGLGTVGPIRICSARATAVTVERTQRLARRDEEPAVFLGLQMAGTSLVVQSGRQCLLRPGEFALYETATPYTLLFEEGVGHHFIRFPRSVLSLPERLLRDVAAVPLGSDNPLAGLAFTYFSGLADDEEMHRGPHAAAVEPSIELVRAVVTSQLGDSSLAREPLEATLSLRITRYMRAHLADPGLSAARIAAAHGVSVRHLYKVLARSGISLGDWIRSHRLAECRRELAGPNGRLRTIAAVGRSWGFVDATHFSKVFRQAYGVSPRAWRDQNHPRPSG
ncbi:helix-turn-helix domain-containing protein [Streptomyces sp. KMM 9044]|uniref:AraC-like ligand-binding domain-containing protein n=1 Tax=Streptomyces sp. KMM 9044 TaxID=2744474 RepID=UPI0021508729|nr:helix-turn-helix domain-containing protein [Streptomyces sp. KMM 9044]WAX77431.1 helix-turn-helix domain-containing protein [Streptomyces sp. KMM 9044]